MKDRRKMASLLLCWLGVLIWFSGQLNAAVLEVGSGKPYSTIQQAVDAAGNNDEIIVYAGTYGGFTINGKDQLTVRAYKDPALCASVGERVTVDTPLYCYNGADNNLIQGFYVANYSTNATCGSYGSTSGNTWRNLVIYGGNSCGLYGSNMTGADLFDHCTIYDNSFVISYTIPAIYINATNTIAAFNGHRGYPDGDHTVSYSNFFDNPHPDSGYTGWTVGTGCITADPQFVSTDPSNQCFLHLQAGSPCIGTASDGGNMGALGTYTPPPDLLSSDPADAECWPRLINNQIRLICSGTITGLPAVPLSIIEEGSGTDVAGGFIYTVATTSVTDDTLVATEDGTVLQDDTRYRIERSGYWANSFTVDVLALRGDLVPDEKVNLIDFAYLAGEWARSGGDSGNCDLNSDGSINLIDLGILLHNWQAPAEPQEPNDPVEPVLSVEFYKFAQNPVLGPSAAPATDAGYTNHNCVRIAPDGTYMMWYTAAPCGDCYPRRIHLATSSDGISWTKQGSVLDKGSPGQFDEYQVHMPTVLWDPDAGAGGLWKMWYTGHGNGIGAPTYDGWNEIGYATSPDGLSWTKHPSNPVFQATRTPGDFDRNTVRSPAVIYDPDDSLYKMWYYGTEDNTGHYGPTGYAESSDGVNWTRKTQINYDESLYVTLEVLKINGVYYTWYNIGPYLGYSWSLDGIVWTEDPHNPILVPTSGTWDSQYLQGPSCVYLPGEDKLYMYYNAVTNYAENIERIGGAWTWFAP